MNFLVAALSIIYEGVTKVNFSTMKNVKLFLPATQTVLALDCFFQQLYTEIQTTQYLEIYGFLFVAYKTNQKFNYIIHIRDEPTRSGPMRP